MKILISTIFQDAGDATRALEIGRIINDYNPDIKNLDIAFLSHGSKFDKEVINRGFRLIRVEPEKKYDNFHDEFDTKFGDLIGNIDVAKDLLAGEITIYKKEKPDIILNGFFPISTIARKISNINCIGISFLPLPLVDEYVNEVTVFPEEIIFSNLKGSFQRKILKAFPTKLKLRNPAIAHNTIIKASKQMGYNFNYHNIFDLLSSDYYFINDYPEFYNVSNYPNNVIFTGPLVPRQNHLNIIDKNISNIISSQNTKLKLFCSLGSVGEKIYLSTIINMFNSKQGQNYSGIVLVPKEICPLEEVKSQLNNLNVVITDKFVPAEKINKEVDIVICHGGQGTLQTAINSGTPIIGVPMQPEQQMNLQHLQDFGAAIKIKRKNWKVSTLLSSIEKIKNNPVFKKNILILKNQSKNISTDRIIGETFWKICTNQKYT